jgi:hypothetical protein
MRAETRDKFLLSTVETTALLGISRMSPGLSDIPRVSIEPLLLERPSGGQGGSSNGC